MKPGYTAKLAHHEILDSNFIEGIIHEQF